MTMIMFKAGRAGSKTTETTSWLTAIIKVNLSDASGRRYAKCDSTDTDGRVCTLSGQMHYSPRDRNLVFHQNAHNHRLCNGESHRQLEHY